MRAWVCECGARNGSSSCGICGEFVEDAWQGFADGSSDDLYDEESWDDEKQPENPRNYYGYFGEDDYQDDIDY